MTVFNNTYFIMRHGESESNSEGIIVSDPQIGCDKYGLTKKGQYQAAISVDRHKDINFTKIFTSDFLRTYETASIVANLSGLTPPKIATELHERYFGRYDGLSADNYNLVWERDASLNHEFFESVESTNHVAKRAVSLLGKLEKKFKDEVILLVSHGDVLQILRTVFINIEPNQHRSLPHHETAEIMQLITKNHDYSTTYNKEII